MQSLIDHARLFPDQVAAAQPHRFAALAHGQQPTALFVACSDSRVIPALFTGAAPGEIFELRTAGNIVPPYRPKVACAVAATLEFAIEVLEIQDVVICGHTHCGAVQALVDPTPLSRLPMVDSWLTTTSTHRLQPHEAELLTDGRLQQQAERHLLAQLLHAHTCPFVQQRVASGQLRLHGWLYAVDTGQITVHQPGSGDFTAL